MKFIDAERDRAPQRAAEPEEINPHHSIYCPTCSHRLVGHRCKLICQHCGYYLSCADYY